MAVSTDAHISISQLPFQKPTPSDMGHPQSSISSCWGIPALTHPPTRGALPLLHTRSDAMERTLLPNTSRAEVAMVLQTSCQQSRSTGWCGSSHPVSGCDVGAPRLPPLYKHPVERDCWWASVVFENARFFFSGVQISQHVVETHLSAQFRDWLYSTWTSSASLVQIN